MPIVSHYKYSNTIRDLIRFALLSLAMATDQDQLQTLNFEDFRDDFFSSEREGVTVADEATTDIRFADDEVPNPLYVSTNGGPILNKGLPKDHQYRRVFILCLDNSVDATNDISTLIAPLFQPSIKKDDYIEMGNVLTMIQGPICMIKNKYHQKEAVIVDRCLLHQFNKKGYELDNDEIIIFLPELKEESASVYRSMYESDDDLTKLWKKFAFFQYFNCDSYRHPITNRLLRMINNLPESEHWENSFNCGLNMTESFQKRQFQYKEAVSRDVMASLFSKNSALSDPSAKKVIDKLTSVRRSGSDGTGSKGGNYLDMLYRKDVYVDASDAVTNNNGFKLYRISASQPPITKEQLANWFRIVSDKERYNMFNALLVSKSHCTLVVNNKEILEIMAPTIKKYLPVYKYLWGYAWICMYMEECITKTRSAEKSRYVFEIDTAAKLPFFPFCAQDVNMNPYSSMLVSKEALNSAENCHGLAMITDFDNYGIGTLESFKRKFNVLTTGTENSCIFDGLETDETGKWKHFAVGGSSITSCCFKDHPLMDQITTRDRPFVERWSRFFNEYNAESDIDIMCNQTNIFDFLDQVENLVTVVTANINKLKGPEQQKQAPTASASTSVAAVVSLLEKQKKSKVPVKKQDKSVASPVPAASPVGSPMAPRKLFAKDSDDEVKVDEGETVASDNKTSDQNNTIKVEVVPSKSLHIMIHQKYIEEHMSEYDLDYVIKNFHSDEIKERIYQQYTTMKLNNNKRLRNKVKASKGPDSKWNPMYDHFLKPGSIDDMNVRLITYNSGFESFKDRDSEISMYLNDDRSDDKKVPQKENILLFKVLESIKFKIHSPHFNHPIEVFKTKYDEFFSCVSRFHLPCVRGYYNGNNVYLLPSCITALMTYTNIDYKYFAGIRDPIDIINKYRMKGIGTMINTSEKAHMLEYNSSVSRWKDMCGIDKKSKTSGLSHFGSKKIGDSMFKPNKFFNGMPDSIYLMVPNKKYVMTVEDMYSMYKEKYGYDHSKTGFDVLKFKTVKDDGSIEPLKRWVWEACYDMF